MQPGEKVYAILGSPERPEFKRVNRLNEIRNHLFRKNIDKKKSVLSEKIFKEEKYKSRSVDIQIRGVNEKKKSTTTKKF